MLQSSLFYDSEMRYIDKIFVPLWARRCIVDLNCKVSFWNFQWYIVGTVDCIGILTPNPHPHQSFFMTKNISENVFKLNCE